MFAMLVLTLSSFSQELKYKDLSSDTIKSSNGKFTSYVSKDGAIYKVGDTLILGVPSSNKIFAFITQGEIMNAFSKTSTDVTVKCAGDKAVILKFWVVGTKRVGYKLEVRTKSISAYRYSIQLENAIASGEIKSFGMTSDEALAEMKKDKDKLELGLITQQKYDSLKNVLIKYIK